MKYRKKPVVVEAITFDELVKCGKSHSGDIVSGMSLSFLYHGHPITYVNDQCYLVSTLEGYNKFTPKDMLVTGVDGEIYPCKMKIFKKTYEPVKKEESL